MKMIVPVAVTSANIRAHSVAPDPKATGRRAWAIPPAIGSFMTR